MAPLVWVITGTSTGLGRDLTIAALNRGDKVIATSRKRSLHKLDELKALGAHALELDVTDTLQSLHEAAKQAMAVHGHIDVLVNNAGFVTPGTLEESSPEETLSQYQTNVFGALNVSRAFLPYMREKKSGTIVFMGSLAGWAALPYSGLYCSTKFALRCLSENLNQEISPFGLRSICFDFGFFRTEVLSTEHRGEYVTRIGDYKEAGAQLDAGLEEYNGKQPGDPKKGVQVIIDVVKGEGLAQGKEIPPCVAVGSDCYHVIKAQCESTLRRIENWKELSLSTDL